MFSLSNSVLSVAIVVAVMYVFVFVFVFYFNFLLLFFLFVLFHSEFRENSISINLYCNLFCHQAREKEMPESYFSNCFCANE